MALKNDEHNETTDSQTEGCCSIKNDLGSICLLLFLYIMQGIPLGLAAAVPYILQSDINTADYQTQATFSLALWPFSLKLLWAPVVDSIYSSRFGRRKSWLIPVQYAIGADLLVLATHVDSWLGREPGNPWGPLAVSRPVNIYSLTAAFFGLTFLAATQDIAVDGWALTMLSKRNLSWASTCNSVGQVLGYVTAFVLFLCLESPNISNTYLRWTPIEGTGLVSFSGFLYFWGIAFLVTTTIVMIFKHEEQSTVTRPIQICMTQSRDRLRRSKNQARSSRQHCASNRTTGPPASPYDDECETDVSMLSPNEGPEFVLMHNGDAHRRGSSEDRYSNHQLDMNAGSPNVIEVFPEDRDCDRSVAGDEATASLSLIDTYRVMLGILSLKPVLWYISIVFVVKGCLAAADSATTLKLLERGVPKERLAFLSIMLLPMQAVLPLMVTAWSNGPRPLSVFARLAPLRLVLTASVIALVYYTPSFAEKVSINATQHNVSAIGNSPLFNSTDTIQYQTIFSWKYYSLILVHMALYSSLSNIMHVCQMAFQARISDPAVGGTYMTLLNTAVNLAGTLPGTLVLYLIDPLSIRHCAHADPLQAGRHTWQKVLATNNTMDMPNSDRLLQLGQQWIAQNATCQPSAGVLACELAGGECVTTLDGFYLQVVISILVGIVMFPLFVQPVARRLDSLAPSTYTFRLSNSRCRTRSCR